MADKKQSLSDKFNFDDNMVNESETKTEPARRKRPPVVDAMTGAVRARPGSGLQYTQTQMDEEKAKLKEQYESSVGITKLMPVTGESVKFELMEVSPELVDVVDKNGRLQEFLDVLSLSDLLPQIKIEGQQQPGMLRPKEGGRYELIYGSRRLASCAHLNRNFQALVGNVQDRDIQSLTDSENVYKGLSFYEQAVAYDKRIKVGEFKSWNALASFYDISNGSRDRYKKACELPKLYLSILPSLSDMAATYPNTIFDLLNKNKDAVEAKAQEILALRNAVIVGEREEYGYDIDAILKELKAAARVALKGAEKPTAREPINYVAAAGGSVKYSLSTKGAVKLEFSDIPADDMDELISDLKARLGLKVKAKSK